MSKLNYIRSEVIPLRGNPEYGEKWVQERIAEDPALLGFGELFIRDKERIQPSGGRLDLLMQDGESTQRYEVEIQLGATDETHIIRTIEYWDVEKRRYPQYEHTAVLVAEDVTGRFLNVISLLNRSIPLVVLQMKAFRVGESVSLVFTKVLDTVQLGLVDEDEDVSEVTDRAYWENRAGKNSLSILDECFGLIKKFDPSLTPKYNKFYIGFSTDDKPRIAVIFRPRTKYLIAETRVPYSDELQRELESIGIDLMDYDKKWGRFRLRLTIEDLRKRESMIDKMFRLAFKEF